MKCTKKVIASLSKCYSLAFLNYNQTTYTVAASEINDKCMMFDLNGNYVDTLWEGPGGVMSMEQVPGSNGQLLATQLFYSPNNSSQAEIAVVTPRGNHRWDLHTLVKLPFVHRIGILQRGGINYFVAATLKSAHAFDEDWTCPGRIWAAELPEDLSGFNKDNQLKMEPVINGLFHNHGFCKLEENGYTGALIGSDSGVTKLIPPEAKGGKWTFETLIDEPTSDMVLVDFDQDGEPELLTLSPFHGNRLTIFKKVSGSYIPVYKHTENLEFLHAIWSGTISGSPSAIIGYRKGKRELLAVRCSDANHLEFTVDTLDSDVGPANILHYNLGGTDYILSANREIDEVALYTIQKK